MVATKELIKTNKGATLDKDLEICSFDNGYMCSLFGTEETFITLDELMDALNNFKSNIKKIDYIGIWFDEQTNLWYLDNSKYYKTKKAAVKNGIKNQQLAIFNWADKEAIYL